VSAGTVNINAPSVINTTGLLTISSGATVQMNAASANQTVTGLDGAGTLRWTIGATNNPRITLDVASGTTTFSGTLSSNQAGNQRVASITKSGGGTQVISSGTAFGFDRTLLTLTGGILQVSANNQLGYLQISGAGGTLQLDGKNQSIDTWAASSTVTNSSATSSTLSSQFNNKDWSGNITGNIKIRNGGAFDTNLRGTNSFSGGVDLSQGAFTITASGQLPANQIDLSGGSLDFTNSNTGLAANITLGSDRTYTVGAGGGSFRYRTNAAGSTTLQGAINNSGTPGSLNFVTHPSFSGASTFTLSNGSSNFSGTTVIGGSSSAANVTLRPGIANGISTSTAINFGGGNTRTYSLDLNGFSQQVAGLQNTGTGTGLVQRVITSSAAAAQVLTVNHASDYAFSGILGDTGTNNDNFGLTKSGIGTLTLSGTSTYTGTTNVSGGTLLINGNNSAASGAVSVGTATLGGNGTVGGATTIGATGKHSPGNNGVGLQKFSSSLAYVGGSIFSWDLNASVEDPIDGSVNKGLYDQVEVTGAVTGAAKFWVVLGLNDFDDAFWDTGKSWDNIFNSGSGSAMLTSIFTTFGGTSVATNGVVTGQGHFSFAQNSNTLQWTAVPEPSNAALVGGLCLISVLRRRRAPAVGARTSFSENHSKNTLFTK